MAGAVAVIQGEALARLGAPLTPYEVRTLLVETGLPQVMGAAGDGNIGPRPQVAAALEGLEGVRGRPPAPAPTPATPTPPAAPVPTPVAPASGVPAPAAPVATTPAPVSPASRPAPRPIAAAARAPRARLARRAARLRLSMRGLAPRARVTVNGRRVHPKRGVVVLTKVRTRTYLVRVTAPPRAGRTYRPVRFTVTVPARGAPRVRTA